MSSGGRNEATDDLFDPFSAHTVLENFEDGLTVAGAGLEGGDDFRRPQQVSVAKKSDGGSSGAVSAQAFNAPTICCFGARENIASRSPIEGSLNQDFLTRTCAECHRRRFRDGLDQFLVGATTWSMQLGCACARYSSTRSVVQVATPQPKKSVASVHIGQSKRAPRPKSANRLRLAGRFARGRRTQTVSRLQFLWSVQAQSPVRALRAQEPVANFAAPKSEADAPELPEMRYRVLEIPFDHRTCEVARVHENPGRRESEYSRRAPAQGQLFFIRRSRRSFRKSSTSSNPRHFSTFRPDRSGPSSQRKGNRFGCPA